MSDDDEAPQFQHDCERCTFLGQLEVFVAVDGTSREFDLYHCARHGMATVLARYGDAGPDYASGVHLAEILLRGGDPHGGIPSALAEAIRRALAKGLPLR